MSSVSTALIDTHSHLLPGIDDGCKTLEESLVCGRGLADAGYTHAFCTPHIWPDYPQNTAENIARQVASLQEAFNGARVRLTLMPGGELNLLSCGSGLRRAKREDVVTYGLHGRYTLFDFWTKSADDVIDRVLPAARRLADLGLQSILAHPERIQVFHHAPELIDEFTAAGVRLQMNTWCLTESPRTPVFQLAARWLKEGRYFMFGTDLHNPPGLAIRINGLKVAADMVGEAMVRTMTVDHPRMLLEG